MDWLGAIVNGFIGDLFTFLAAIVDGLFGALGFPSLQQAVFGVEAGNQSLGYVRPHGPFDATQWAGLMHLEALFVQITWALVVILLGWLAYRMMHIPDARAAGEVTSLAWRLVCIGLMVSLVPWGFDQLLAANLALAHSIAAWQPAAVGLLSSNVLSAAAQVGAQPGIDHGALLAIDGILKLAVAVLRLVIAVLLVERTLVLAALLVVGPVVCWSWVWNPRGTAWGLWLSELISLAFIPASLAIVGAAMQALFWSEGVTGWARLASLMFMVPAAGLLRKLITGFFGLIGMREDRAALGVAGGMLAAGMAGGVAAIGGVGRALLPGAGVGLKAGGGPGAGRGVVGGAGAAAGRAGAPGAPTPGLPGAGRPAGGAAQAATAGGPSALGLAAGPAVQVQPTEERLRRALAYGAEQGRGQAPQAGWVRAAAAVTGAAGAVAGGAAVAGLHLAGLRLNSKDAAALAGKGADAGRGLVVGPVGALAAKKHATAEYRRELAAQGGPGLDPEVVSRAGRAAILGGTVGTLRAAHGLAPQQARETREAARRERWLSGLDGPELV